METKTSNLKAPYHIRETAWKELGFRKLAMGKSFCWRVVNLKTGEDIGQWSSRSALLADPMLADIAKEIGATLIGADKCRWFLKCAETATGTTPHPILGDVPTCDGCAAWARR
jgi:hypothetical protein